ncbi:GGDEF domain-containing protein [Brevibacillus sp. SYP-B805]|uniref:GGDEF domain-containing protein n=1 Tax=Brevibacillus sp. SYP-B805 TaxID=1578199 RepID=UPI00321688DD
METFMCRQLYGVSSGKSAQYAAEKMNELKVGSLVVFEEGKVVGIVTSRDIRAAHPNRIVADVMTANPLSIHKNAFIGQALAMMEENEVERLLVMDDHEVIGIVTRETLREEIGKNIDPLTGLYRASYIEYLYNFLVEQQTRFHLFFLDLNNFGEINKKYSHIFGNEVLTHFANRLKEICQDGDYLCRYGGDEFVVITKREQSELQFFYEQMKRPIAYKNVAISFSVGFLNGNLHDLFAKSYEESIREASLLSTKAKFYAKER